MLSSRVSRLVSPVATVRAPTLPATRKARADLAIPTPKPELPTPKLTTTRRDVRAQASSMSATEFDSHYGETKDTREGDFMIRIEGDFGKADADALLHEFAYCGDAAGIAFEGDLVFIEFGTPAEAREAVKHGDGKSVNGKGMRVRACDRSSCHIDHDV